MSDVNKNKNNLLNIILMYMSARRYLIKNLNLAFQLSYWHPKRLERFN